MIILGIDTSTSTAGMAVIGLNGRLAEPNVNLKTDYSEKLLSSIDYLLSSARLGLNDVSGFSISIGPGSFTGLRIGLATVKGLSYASSKPIVKVASLDAIAWRFQYSSYPIASVMSAPQEGIYIALYKKYKDGIRRTTSYSVLPLCRLSEMIKAKTLFVGPGVDTYRKKISRILRDKTLFLPEGISYINGEAVARIGMKKLLAGEVEDPKELEPLYVREANVQIKSSRAN